MVGHVRQGADFSHGAVAEFIEALKSAPAGTNATVFDVGANDGSWAASWKGHIDLFRKESKRLELYFFEPQPHFAGKLTQLAEDIGAFCAGCGLACRYNASPGDHACRDERGRLSECIGRPR